MTRPLFTSFDDAWAWFAAGGSLETLEERRERFTRGRAQFLSFQAPIVAPEALSLIESVRDALERISAITPLPDEHLHISIRGAGFQVLRKQHPDEIAREDTGPIGERAAQVFRTTKPIAIALGPVNVFPDALVLEVHDEARLAGLRARLHESVHANDTLIDDAHYLPHVTIAGFTSPHAVAVLRERLAALRDLPPVPVTLTRIDFARWWFTGFDDRESTELEIVRTYTLR